MNLEPREIIIEKTDSCFYVVKTYLAPLENIEVQFEACENLELILETQNTEGIHSETLLCTS